MDRVTNLVCNEVDSISNPSEILKLVNENQPEIVICKEMELPPTVVERFPDSVRILCEGTIVLILLSQMYLVLFYQTVPAATMVLVNQTKLDIYLFVVSIINSWNWIQQYSHRIGSVQEYRCMQYTNIF